MATIVCQNQSLASTKPCPSAQLAILLNVCENDNLLHQNYY